MSTTIAVTLITALSTLAGVSISGYIALRISHSQGKTQITLNQSQLLEQRVIERRQIRRDAYVQFFNQLGVTEQVFASIWMSSPSISDVDDLKSQLTKMTNSANDLQRASNLVTLEGPREVGLLAIEMGILFQEESGNIARLIVRAPKEKPLAGSAKESFQEARIKRDVLKVRLIVAIQKNLDNVFNSAAVEL
jgi:hypothetical protein